MDVPISLLDNNGYLIRKDQISNINDIILLQSNITNDNETYLYVPRFYGINKFGPPLIDLLPLHKDIIYDEQIQLSEMQNYYTKQCLILLKKLGGCTLCLPIGYGKKIMCTKMISSLSVKTIIIVNYMHIGREWEDVINKLNKKVTLIYNNNISNLKENDITIILSNLLINSVNDKLTELILGTGLTLIDEYVSYQPKKLSNIIGKIGSKYIIGLNSQQKSMNESRNVYYTHIMGPSIDIK